MSVPGTVYLIHFASKLHHAQHYIGWTSGESIDQRISKHLRGDGAKILAACNRLGITWEVVRTWDNVDRHFERWLKNKKSTGRLCPVCIETAKKLELNHAV